MSSADLWEDGYPHGTVEGFNGGCRGGSCPLSTTPKTQQPEWAEVTISEDVERARSVAIHLEQELARMQDERDQAANERDTALAALGTALRAWEKAQDDYVDESNANILLRLELDGEKAFSRDLGEQLDRAITDPPKLTARDHDEIAKRIVADPRPRRSWWRR